MIVTREVMKKILTIKISALGDVLIALPHMDVILSHHSQDQVLIITSPPKECYQL